MADMLYVVSVFVVVCMGVEGTLTPPVDTTHGPVIGEVHTYDGTTVHVFKGIPFASPPVGNLRFAAPQLPEPWTEPLETVKYRNRCMANAIHDSMLFFPPREAPPMDEDCLHLTLVTPQSQNTDKRWGVLTGIIIVC